MKLVINKCYGGFSLSSHAVKRLAELQGKKCFFFKRDMGSASRSKTSYTPVTAEECEKSLFWSAFTTPNPNKDLPTQDNWAQMTQRQRTASNKAYEKHHLENRPENRADPLLVQVVEELGEKANGSCAKLSVIEIPDDVDWEIDEYDGMESVAEKHRSWH